MMMLMVIIKYDVVDNNNNNNDNDYDDDDDDDNDDDDKWNTICYKFDYHLTHSTLGKIFSRRHYKILFLFSLRKQV